MDRFGTEQALTFLAELLVAKGAEPLDLVVCGGSALRVMGLIDRATRDVDLLAILRKDEFGNPLLFKAEPLPEILQEAVGMASSIAMVLATRRI